MKRRKFIGSSLIVVPGVSFMFPHQLLANSSNAPSLNAQDLDYLFLDERYSDSASVAKQIKRVGKLVSVRGDVTPVWNNLLKSASQEQNLTLSGITGESFYFCLQRLLHSSSRLHAEIEKIDEDFYAWSIVTANV